MFRSHWTLQGWQGPWNGRVPVHGRCRLPTMAALGAGAAIAVVAIPGSDGTVTFCHGDKTDKGAQARIVDSVAELSRDESGSH